MVEKIRMVPQVHIQDTVLRVLLDNSSETLQGCLGHESVVMRHSKQ